MWREEPIVLLMVMAILALSLSEIAAFLQEVRSKNLLFKRFLRFSEELARPIINESCLEASYRDMILDEDRECEADEWTEGLVGDSLPGAPDVPR